MQNVTENNQDIASRIHRALVAKGWNQADLVTKSGVDKSHVSRLARGARGEGMRKETREKIASALGVSPEWLFAGYGPDPFSDAPQPTSSPEGKSERYPSRRAAAAALRGIVDNESISAMLSEEHYGSETDPGPEFWFNRGLWWDAKRKEAKSGVAPPRSDLDEPPPMTARPKKVKRG